MLGWPSQRQRWPQASHPRLHPARPNSNLNMCLNVREDARKNTETGNSNILRFITDGKSGPTLETRRESTQHLPSLLLFRAPASIWHKRLLSAVKTWQHLAWRPFNQDPVWMCTVIGFLPLFFFFARLASVPVKRQCWEPVCQHVLENKRWSRFTPPPLFYNAALWVQTEIILLFPLYQLLIFENTITHHCHQQRKKKKVILHNISENKMPAVVSFHVCVRKCETARWHCWSVNKIHARLLQAEASAWPPP